mgnify:CR=1 FL=1
MLHKFQSPFCLTYITSQKVLQQLSQINHPNKLLSKQTIYVLPCYAVSVSCHFIDVDLQAVASFVRSIQRILKYPPTRTLSGDERQLLWKFRFSLMSEKRALTKFLRCVEWSDVQVHLHSSYLPILLWLSQFSEMLYHK